MKKLLNKKALTPVSAAAILLTVIIGGGLGIAIFVGSFAASEVTKTELTVTGMDFTVGDASGRIFVHVDNTLTKGVTVGGIRVNGQMSYTWSAQSSSTIAKDASETFTIIQPVSAGTQYTVNIYDTDGTLRATCTKTA